MTRVQSAALETLASKMQTRRAKVVITRDDLDDCVCVKDDDSGYRSLGDIIGEPGVTYDRARGDIPEPSEVCGAVWIDRCWQLPTVDGDSGTYRWLRDRGASKQVAREAAADLIRSVKEYAAKVHESGHCFGIVATAQRIVKAVAACHATAGVPFTRYDRFDVRKCGDDVDCWGFCDTGDGREIDYAKGEALDTIAYNLRLAGYTVDDSRDANNVNRVNYLANRRQSLRHQINSQNRR